MLADTTFTISTFGEDDAGNVYVADYGAGAIYQVRQLTPDISRALTNIMV
jgi:hypothetical protein